MVYIDLLCISAATEVAVAKQGPCTGDLQVWHNVYGEGLKSADDLDVLDEAVSGGSSEKRACPEPVEGFIHDDNGQQKTQVVLLSRMGRVECHQLSCRLGYLLGTHFPGRESHR